MQKLLRLPLLLGVVLAGSFNPLTAAATAESGVSWSGTYLAGRTAGRLRDIDAASGYVADALRHDPANIVLTERLFILELSSGDLPAAEELAARVITFNSEHRMARLVLGMRDMKQGRYAEARAHFAESAYTPIGQLAANLLSAWSYTGEKNLSAALAELSKLESNESFANFKSFHEALIADFLNSQLRAEQAYRTAFEVAGSSLRVTQAYGSYMERIGKASQAERIYQQFLDASERNILIQDALNRTQKKLGKAEPLIQSVLDGAGEALFSLAAAMNEGDSIEVALVYAQLAKAYSRDKAVMVTLLADIQADMNRYQTAIESYDQVPKDSPLRPNAETEIALNLQRLEKPVEAVARLTAIIIANPKNYAALVTLGNVNRANENYAEAEKAYTSAVALFGPEVRENWQLYYFRGICFERIKKWDEAERDFRKAIALSPEEASVLNYLGYSLIDRNSKLDEAVKMVQKAVELRPNDGYIIDSLGWAYYQLARYDEAVAELERAVELKAGDPIIAEHLGDAYWKVGRQVEARFQWQHAKDNEPEPDDLKRIELKLRDGLESVPAQAGEKIDAPKG